MQRFTISFAVCLFCMNAMAGAYLPVVDVSNGMVSARAAFGEEISTPKRVEVASARKDAVKQPKKRVVARAAKKTVNTGETKIVGDVLKPNRPSADLWANNDSPLRMPRMDEISVVRSDDLLPEESLNQKPVHVAKQQRVERDNETLSEMNALKKEIARLKQRQKQTEENILAARNSVEHRFEEKNMQTQPKKAIPETSYVDTDRMVNVRREVVPMETKKDVMMRSIAQNTSEPKIATVDNSMSKMSPSELKKAFKKTYLSENKHLSTYSIDDRFDVSSDMTSDIEGFTAQRDLSEMSGGIRPLELKISFMNNDSGLSRDNYNLLSETASIVVNNPKRAIQIAIPEAATYTKDARKLAARRLAIVEQVLRDTGVAEQRIVPVLSQRDDDVFVLRIISGEMFETLTQKKRNMFGDNVSKKTYKSMTW